MDWNVWGAPFVVLAVGMVVGLVLALQSRGTARRRSADEAWALKESLVDQLRSLRAMGNRDQPYQLHQMLWHYISPAKSSMLQDG